MNITPKVGIVTIGQSPRVDVVPEIIEIAGVRADYLESGALDGLEISGIAKLAPAKDEYMLVTRLNSGVQVPLAQRKIVQRIQGCIDKLVEHGADIVIVLCVGEWPKFRSEKLIVTPS